MSSIIAQKQKIEPELTGIKQNTGDTKYSKIKVQSSKISSNFDLPHSLVFMVLLLSMNVCVGNIKRIKTTENRLNLECILRTRWALFCISPQSLQRKLFILTAISKPCPPFTAFCEETSTVTPNFFYTQYLHLRRTV